MASLKWVKLSIELFSDERILLLENEPQGERHLLLWFRLLLLAAKLNNGGALILDGVPLTPRKIASIIKKKPSYVAGGMAVLCQNRLIYEENGLYYIPNWDKHQSEDRLEKIREQDRIRKREAYRKAKEFSKEFSAENSRSLQPQNKKEKENQNKNENIFMVNNNDQTVSHKEPIPVTQTPSQAPCIEDDVGIIPQPPTYNRPSLPPALTQTVTAYCEALSQANNPAETHTLLLTWLCSLQEKNRLPSATALPLILEKLPAAAKESGMEPPAYLREAVCRGWNNFYPVPTFKTKKSAEGKSRSSSYDIEELEAMI